MQSIQAVLKGLPDPNSILISRPEFWFISEQSLNPLGYFDRSCLRSFVLPLPGQIPIPPGKYSSHGKVFHSSRSALRFPRIPLILYTPNPAFPRASSGAPCI
ncbi:hypothetical protein T10_4914 [Trichinella papuae]|uniref:Uncharacterized protein n=1 Tax=Trichinella papuae TaxID=268474 RepID=A0A0V1MG74_9BILA|nr:hypothetical protein T10_4914 [Trichinella papuae]